MSVPHEASQPPEWVRRRDGRQVPFDADRICQSLFAAGAALEAPNAFLARELTDAVVHFLAQDFLDPVPTTAQVVEHVEKIVRELGHPALARRYVEMRIKSAVAPQAVIPSVAIGAGDSPDDLVERCLEAYSLNVIFSNDLRAAWEEGLLHLSGLTAPDTLTSFLVDARTLGEESWWVAWEPWQACGSHWIVDSPEWLSILLADRLPIVRLCERIVTLPRVANHPVELHLNVAQPPTWIQAEGIGPLFAGEDNPFSLSHRFGFLDMLLEQCLATEEDHAPALAWHLSNAAFDDPSQMARLKMLVRQAILGRAVRFIFDRPRFGIALSEGMDRQCPGVLLDVGLDLAAFAQRPEIAQDGAALLKKLPSLARMAVSAAEQKRRYLRDRPEDAALQRGFLIERAACTVVPCGLDTAVRAVTGQSAARSPLSLDFALKILQTLRNVLHDASRASNLDFQLDSPTFHTPLPPGQEGLGVRGRGVPQSPALFLNGLSVADANVSLEKQLEISGRLHAGAGAGTATLLLAEDSEATADSLVQLLHWAWRETSVVRVELQRAEATVHQGVFSV